MPIFCLAGFIEILNQVTGMLHHLGLRKHSLECCQIYIIVSMQYYLKLPGSILRELTIRIANPFIGFFYFITLTSMLWEISLRRLSPIFFLAAVIFPFAIYHEMNINPYWYSFRFLNAPTLDKDFCLFIILPMMTICASKFLTEKGNIKFKWIMLLVAAMPAALLSHPITAVYFVINSFVIAVSWFKKIRIGKIIILSFLAFFSYWISTVVINPANTHAYIENLTQYDLKTQGGNSDAIKKVHYWTGHYVARWNLDNSVRWFKETDLPYVAASHTFKSSAVKLSALFSVFWIYFSSVKILLRQ